MKEKELNQFISLMKDYHITKDETEKREIANEIVSKHGDKLVYVAKSFKRMKRHVSILDNTDIGTH